MLRTHPLKNQDHFNFTLILLKANTYGVQLKSINYERRKKKQCRTLVTLQMYDFPRNYVFTLDISQMDYEFLMVKSA